MRMVKAGSVAAVALAIGGGVAQAAPELSVSDRLPDRRYMASGERAYTVGFQDGRFYANGWHITGEMGGVWTPPLKLVDGVWFGVDGQWVGPATRFTQRLGLCAHGPAVRAGPRAAPHRLRSRRPPRGAVRAGLTNRGPSTRTVTVDVDAHSELMGAYPWGFDAAVPNARDNLADSAAFDGDALVFREQGKLPHPNAEVHDYAALVASDRKPRSGVTGDTFRGDQGDNVCTAAGAAERL